MGVHLDNWQGKQQPDPPLKKKIYLKVLKKALKWFWEMFFFCATGPPVVPFGTKKMFFFKASLMTPYSSIGCQFCTTQSRNMQARSIVMMNSSPNWVGFNNNQDTVYTVKWAWRILEDCWITNIKKVSATIRTPNFLSETFLQIAPRTHCGIFSQRMLHDI